MAKTFMQMVQEAKAAVPGVRPVDAQRLFQENPDALLLEVRDAENIPADQKAPNMVNISLGSLPIRADLEVPEERRDIRLADRSRQVITTCGVGNLAAMGARLLKEMGFTNGSYMDGGMQGWKDAGLPTPTCIVNSGHGCHAYWRLTDPITDLRYWSESQKRLISLIDSDPVIHDPPRIMRVPGFINQKQSPVPCKIIYAEPNRRYQYDRFLLQI
mgnify:CR=1 FL=1